MPLEELPHTTAQAQNSYFQPNHQDMSPGCFLVQPNLRMPKLIYSIVLLSVLNSYRYRVLQRI